jgi:hypothetical protein
VKREEGSNYPDPFEEERKQEREERIYALE